MKVILMLLGLGLISLFGRSQTPFNVSLEPLEIEGVPGLQSFAIGQDNGKWLVLGGRLDGLHRRQPWASFDSEGFNKIVYVIDPESQEIWQSPLSEISTDINDRLSTTNMEFYQEGMYLYIIGGYGYDSSIDDNVTFPNLLVINVPQMIEDVINGDDLDPNIRMIENGIFAVTGGNLEKVYDEYYLTGGQKFDGFYNPMNMNTFTQEYTNSITRFKIIDDGENLEIVDVESYLDEENLHRRDFNVVSQIMPNGEEGLTAFSGVFQMDADIPYLSCVNIDSSGYELNPDFSQYFNHYHCANVALYSEEYNEMHTLFFGGIAQYYQEGEELIMDNEVPFVNTIARVSRDQDGVMTEYKLSEEMPGYLGAGAEFILTEVGTFNNNVIKLDEIESDSTLIGYIYGGINSSQKNIFWINDGTQSSGSAMIYKVYLIQGESQEVHMINPQSLSSLRMQVYPNPSDGIIHVDFILDYRSSVHITLLDQQGKLVVSETLEEGDVSLGINQFYMELNDLEIEGVYYLKLETSREGISQTLLINK